MSDETAKPPVTMIDAPMRLDYTVTAGRNLTRYLRGVSDEAAKMVSRCCAGDCDWALAADPAATSATAATAARRRPIESAHYHVLVIH